MNMIQSLIALPETRDWRELLSACKFAEVDPYLETLCLRVATAAAASQVGSYRSRGVMTLVEVVIEIRASGWNAGGILELLAACSVDENLSEVIAPRSVFEHAEYGPLIPYVTKRRGQRVLVLEPLTAQISDSIQVLVIQ
jgi:hypothetical protein